jgi:hypothetical protein
LQSVLRRFAARENQILVAVEMVHAIYFVAIVMVDAMKFARKLIVIPRNG